VCPCVVAGDTTSSCRLFDSILAGASVVVSDDVDPPFEELLDYTRFALFVPTLLAHRRKYLVRLLRGSPTTSGCKCTASSSR